MEYYAAIKKNKVDLCSDMESSPRNAILKKELIK